MEYLTEVDCVKCSLKKTLEKLHSSKSEGTMKLIHEIEHQIKSGEFEADNNPEVIISSTKSKQAMFAKPPKILCLHFVRSLYLPTGDIIKNTCQVEFPSILDLTPYCTNGTLETEPYLPISTPDHITSTKYRLMSTVVHYGDHFSGHYIAYKRKLNVSKCNCPQCGDNMTLFESHENEWYKISDDKVAICKTQDALDENPFMLLYELIEDEESHTSSCQLEPSIVQRERYEATSTKKVDLSYQKELFSKDAKLPSTIPLPLSHGNMTLRNVKSSGKLTTSCLTVQTSNQSLLCHNDIDHLPLLCK